MKEIIINIMMIFIGLGSSIGDAEVIFDSVEKMLTSLKIEVVKKSSILKNPPFGNIAKNEFANAVWQIESSKSPYQLLEVLQKIEIAHGRIRKKKWDDRTLDLDILMFGNTVLDKEKLTIPHPGIPERLFVLQPWMEIVNEEFAIPGMGQVKKLLKRIESDTLTP